MGSKKSADGIVFSEAIVPERRPESIKSREWHRTLMGWRSRQMIEDRTDPISHDPNSEDGIGTIGSEERQISKAKYKPDPLTSNKTQGLISIEERWAKMLNT